jgi:hypothetical protein
MELSTKRAKAAREGVNACVLQFYVASCGGD